MTLCVRVICMRSSQWLEEVVLDGCATLWGFTLTHPRLRRISLLGCNGLKEVSSPCHSFRDDVERTGVKCADCMNCLLAITAYHYHTHW